MLRCLANASESIASFSVPANLPVGADELAGCSRSGCAGVDAGLKNGITQAAFCQLRRMVYYYVNHRLHSMNNTVEGDVQDFLANFFQEETSV